MMARRKGQPATANTGQDSPVHVPKRMSSRKLGNPVIPTGDPRHMTKIREGTFAPDKYFSRKIKSKLTLTDDEFVQELRS